LGAQIQLQRNITAQLQGRVRQLDQQLKRKETRLAVMNARLAELEKQLKNKKTSAKTPPQS
jgi:pilus assembly protein FimV